MTRRIRRRLPESPHSSECSTSISDRYEDPIAPVDWTSLPSDVLLHIFSLLNYRDRARLASTCLSLRSLAASPSLYLSLDLRPHRLDHLAALSLSPRCPLLHSLRFRSHDSAASIIHLKLNHLRELSGDHCRELTDSTLSVIAARHPSLESLQLDPCVKITSDAIRHVAICCNRLKRLRLTGVSGVDAEAINALAKHCPDLEEVAFLDCGSVDETALGKVVSLRFLSVAGTRTGSLKWGSAVGAWSKLPNLVGLDVSRTDVSAIAVARILSLSGSLKFMLALNCPGVEEEESWNPAVFRSKTKLLITIFSDVVKLVSLFFMVASVSEAFLFGDLYNWNNRDENFVDIKNWLEWTLSHSLLRLADSNPVTMDDFWLRQGADLLLSLFKSPQEEVQERAATALATFVLVDDDNIAVDAARVEAVLRSGGIPLLFTLAKSPREGVQSEAARAIAHLSVNSRFAKGVADEGGICILADLARSMNKYVAEEAAGGLWNLSIGEHKAAIAESGGVKALVDLIFKWQSGIDGVLERAAGAVANLAADDKCSIGIARAGGVHALVMLAKSCKVEGVLEQTARALANLAAHGDNNSNNTAVGQEAGALEALVQLTCSHSEGVRQEAAGALWNLSFDDRNREAIAAAGGVEALVALAQSCINSSPFLQERAAGALWGLSVSEANSIAIGNEGGVAPLISLVRSNFENVHETAAGALWNLAFNSGNALRIVEEGGVPALVHLCSSSGSKMAKFMAALALSYMFDGRLDEVTVVGSSSESVTSDGARRMALKHIEAFVLTFSNPQLFSTAVVSSTPAVLAQVSKSARIEEAGHLRCSGAEIGRFVTMLRNPSSILRACAAFALFQFTTLGGRHTVHHAGLLKTAGAARVLRGAAAATTATLEAKIFARIVLRNLERLQFAPPL